MKSKILIIEDDNVIRENVKDLLSLIDYDVIVAPDGKSGVKKALEELPDLIICDILMPEMNGYQVLEELQKSTKTELIPFIFLTAKSDHADIRKGMQIGADDYIMKPFNAGDLIKSVKIRLEKAKLIRERSSGSGEKKYDYEESFLINSGGEPHLINVKDIVYIDANNQYTNLHLSDKSKLEVRRSVNNWEKLLPDTHFYRIHRSIIVNKNYIEKFEKWFNNSLLIRMSNIEEPFKVSQRFAVKIKNKLM